MNQRNFQKELDRIISEAEASGRRPKLLLHACCAPCSSYCLEYLCRTFDITVLYGNSNIDDPEEYKKRRAEEQRLIAEMVPEVKFREGRYDPELFHRLVRGHELDPEGQERCGICFHMRLEEAARIAAEEGFDYFTTSLTISPLKDAARINGIGEEEAERSGSVWLPSDFKKKNGYRRSVELSALYGLYRQDYCGCSYSRRERAEAVKNKQSEE